MALQQCYSLYEYYDPIMDMCMSCENLCARGIDAEAFCKKSCPDYFDLMNEPQPRFEALAVKMVTTTTETDTMETVDEVSLLATWQMIVVLSTVVVFFVLLVVAAICCVLRRAQKKKQPTEENTAAQVDLLPKV